MNYEIMYKANPTAEKFHASLDRVRAITGGMACGKTTACVVEMFIRCMEQKQSSSGPRQGLRSSRWAVCCNVQDSIHSTFRVMKEWFPMLQWDESTKSASYCDSENDWLFSFFSKADYWEGSESYSSSEFTGAWLVDAKNIPLRCFSQMLGRVSRYPAVRHGGCSWSGIIMDYDRAPHEHWLYNRYDIKTFKCASPVVYDETSFIVNGNAENLKYLPKDYYETLLGMWEQSEIEDNLLI